MSPIKGGVGARSSKQLCAGLQPFASQRRSRLGCWPKFELGSQWARRCLTQSAVACPPLDPEADRYRFAIAVTDIGKASARRVSKRYNSY